MAKYTRARVRELSNENHLYIIHSNKVYEVSDFVDRHPGGEGVLLDNSGQDVSKLMSSDSSHVHTKAAYQILHKYYVGELDAQPCQLNLKQQHQQRHLSSGRADQGDKQLSLNASDHCLEGYRETELVDWEKPMLWQVGKLGRSYNDWVHAPTDRPLRLFQSNFVEYFSATPWWAIPMVWIPVMFTFLLLSYLNFQRDPPILLPGLYGGVSVELYHLPVIFAAGLLLWTFLEYVLHRWLFHMAPPPDSRFLITLHFLLHGQHHKCPFDKGRLVFPPVPGAVFAFGFFVLYMSVFPISLAYAMLGGTMAGYISYDLTHYYLHHGTPALSYFRSLKSYHVKHHFTHQHMGFGISSRLWDYPFGTLIKDDPTAKSQ